MCLSTLRIQSKMIIFLTLLYFSILIIPKVSAQEIVFNDVSNEVVKNIKIYYYERINKTIKLNLQDGLNLSNQPLFNKNVTTHFHFPGWGENALSPSVQQLSAAFLKNNIRNFAVFDYSHLLKNTGNPLSYVGSVLNISDISTAIACFLKAYIPNIQPVKLIHLQGHSLGGHIMGMSARIFGPKRLRLTGLDPAGPGFIVIVSSDRLRKSDGSFVDVIHTDGKKYGDVQRMGHVDFYPNRGVSPQPGCKRDIITFCSHQRSWQYYAESISNGTAFLAKQCNNGILCGTSLALCKCNSCITQYMGYSVNTSIKGTFYLKTNSKPPYGMGKSGIVF